ncbi:TPA: M48 family metallopeptidase [Candidatus Spyradomonas excrementavium]|nr:M48 family metallopeptidase [Candidatus Spyradomonas excrementavium]
MKKFLIGLIVFIAASTACFADNVYILEKDAPNQQRVMKIGYRVLNANQIENRMTFLYSNKNVVNAAAYARSKTIVIYKGLLPFIDDDNEIAAIICHEVAHGLDYFAGYWRRVAMDFLPKKYERKADLKGVDLMVNAGYNPVAMIVVLNKICDEPSYFENGGTHPAGSERLAAVYEYIYAKYPAYLADNDYKNNLYYQNFLLTSKAAREQIRKKYNQSAVVPVSNKKTEESK